MRHQFQSPTDLRTKAEFFQRLTRGARSILIREELETLSLRFMDEASALERELTIPTAPFEIAARDAQGERV